jgi:hypothetical protein
MAKRDRVQSIGGFVPNYDHETKDWYCEDFKEIYPDDELEGKE